MPFGEDHVKMVFWRTGENVYLNVYKYKGSEAVAENESSKNMMYRSLWNPHDG